MNKKAFVLIEIIMSVVLLSIAGTALFKANINHKKLYSIANKKTEFSKYISILTNKHSTDLHNRGINLYEFIKKSYTIKNAHLIKTLKSTKIHYYQKNQTLLYYSDNNDTNNINILIDEIKLLDSKGTSRYLSVKM